MSIQDELQKIHHQYGVSEKANYEIELLFNKMLLPHITRSEKWVSLAAEIGAFYGEDEDEGEDEGNLCDIGETAAMAFGYMG
jgi:hypothetical protein